jgi:MYXO-CTERM domain-containing protein
VFASGYQTIGLDEHVTFSGNNPGSLYLELPGIVGEHNTPGHPNVMKLDSVNFFANDFTSVRPLDSASPALAQAVVQGTQFPEARLLFYDAALPVGSPQQIWSFSTLIGSAYQLGGGASESVSFNFASIPEPASAALGVIGLGTLLAARRRGRNL